MYVHCANVYYNLENLSLKSKWAIESFCFWPGPHKMFNHLLYGVSKLKKKARPPVSSSSQPARPSYNWCVESGFQAVYYTLQELPRKENLLVVVLRMTALNVAETGAAAAADSGAKQKNFARPLSSQSAKTVELSTAPKGLYSSILLDSFLAIENPLDRMAKLYGNLVMG